MLVAAVTYAAYCETRSSCESTGSLTGAFGASPFGPLESNSVGRS